MSLIAACNDLRNLGVSKARLLNLFVVELQSPPQVLDTLVAMAIQRVREVR